MSAPFCASEKLAKPNRLSRGESTTTQKTGPRPGGAAKKPVGLNGLVVARGRNRIRPARDEVFHEGGGGGPWVPRPDPETSPVEHGPPAPGTYSAGFEIAPSGPWTIGLNWENGRAQFFGARGRIGERARQPCGISSESPGFAGSESGQNPWQGPARGSPLL